MVGLPVLAAEANGALSSPWRRGLALLAALAGVFAVLFLVRRSAREAAVPLIPIALATGWSAGILFVLGLLPGPLEVDLNPMSVTLGALVIAISTEFSVLLSSRYRQERERGAGPARAIELTYASTGAAVLASGATAIAGFAALIFSDIRMLRDFGIVTVVDLSVSLLGVMIVLPAALMWAEEHGPFRVPRLRPPAAEPRRELVSDEDRFDDLSGRRDGWRERDRTHPEPVRKPEVPRPGQQVRLAGGHPDADGPGRAAVRPDAAQPRARGSRGRRRARSCAPSRRPRRSGNLEGDANVCQKAPCPEQAGGRPACELTSEEVVNLCELREKPLVLTVIFDRGADCYPQVDRTERVRADFEDVNFATLFFTRKERDEVRRLVQARGWRQPVAIDQDGAVANLYGVGGCPTTIFTRAGGKVVDTKLGNVTEDELRRRAEGAELMELELSEGWVEAELAADFPELALVHTELDARPRRSPREVKQRLRAARRPLHRRQGDPHAPGRRPVGLSRLLAPGGDRPRQRPHAGGGAGRGAPAPRRAEERERGGRRAHDRHRRDRRAGVRARRGRRWRASSGCAWPAPASS